MVRQVGFSNYEAQSSNFSYSQYLWSQNLFLIWSNQSFVGWFFGGRKQPKICKRPQWKSEMRTNRLNLIPKNKVLHENNEAISITTFGFIKSKVITVYRVCYGFIGGMRGLCEGLCYFRWSNVRDGGTSGDLLVNSPSQGDSNSSIN